MPEALPLQPNLRGDLIHGTVCLWLTRPPDAKPYLCEVVRPPQYCEGYRLHGERRQRWRIMARNDQEARKTADYHFGMGRDIVVWPEPAASPSGQEDRP